MFTHTSCPHPRVSAHTAQEPLPTYPLSLNPLQEAWFPHGHTVTPLLGSWAPGLGGRRVCPIAEHRRRAKAPASAAPTLGQDLCWPLSHPTAFSPQVSGGADAWPSASGYPSQTPWWDSGLGLVRRSWRSWLHHWVSHTILTKSCPCKTAVTRRASYTPSCLALG